MKSRQLIILFAIMANFNVLCQLPKEPVNVQAPNSSSFNAIGEIKLNSFSGSPSIDVPLCNLSDGAINIPLGASYDAKGIKPDIHPGWVGQNMNLSAGGAVVRTVKDGVDDNPYSDSRGPLGFFFTNSNLNIASWSTQSSIITLGNRQLEDKEPDEFNFNASDGSGNDISGKFYFGHDGSWKVQSEQNIKVETIGTTSDTYPPFIPPTFTGNIWESDNNHKYMGHTAGFIITDEKGTKYEFGGGDNSFMEYSIDFFDQGKDTWVCNSWHLKSITTATGQTINYTYERGNFIAQMYFSVTSKAYSVTGSGFLNQSCDGWTSNLDNVGPYSGKLISPIYLKEINTTNLKVKFISSITTELPYDEDVFTKQINYVTDHPVAGKATKLDIMPFLFDCFYPVFNSTAQCNTSLPISDLLSNLKWRKLDTIQVFSTFNAVPIKKKEYAFEYNNVSTERLMLKKIQEIGSTADKINPYEFFYNSYSALPNYCKSHTDHWGFNNGKVININNDFNVSPSYGTDFRTPPTDLNVYLSGSLSKIIYPTKGFTEFLFEPNTYSSEVKLNRNSGVDTYTANQNAGGLRIRKIKTFDPLASNPTIEKEYFYVNNFNPQDPTPNTPLLSSGVLGGKSQYYWNDYKPTADNPASYPNYTEEIFTTQSVLPATENSMGSHIGYSEIVEKMPSGGWTVYKYSNFDNGGGQYLDESFKEHLQQSATVFEPFNSRAYRRGKLIEKADYSQQGQPVRKINFTYQDQMLDTVRSIKTNTKYICSSFNRIHEGTAYHIYTNQYKITNEVETTYDTSTPSQSVAKNTGYIYNIYGQLKETKQSQSDGSEAITRVKYVPEYNTTQWNQYRSTYISCLVSCFLNGGGQACRNVCLNTYNANKNTYDNFARAIMEMRDKHIYSPIETINYRKRSGVEQITGGSLNLYKTFGTLQLPNKFHRLHLNDPLAVNTVNFTDINASKQLPVSSYYQQPEIEFNKYNTAGNPLELKARDGIITNYIWGYRNRLPIAEIKNETYTVDSTALGADVDNLLNNIIDTVDIRTKINLLRSNLNRKVTTYTHDVVFGVKSITDPAGINILFNYDGLGKLKSAVDNQGYILKDIIYQYAGQAAQTGLGATPTNTLNYIISRIPRTPQTNISTDINSTNTSIQYADGLGRVVQSLIWKGSPDQNSDIINATNNFDLAGRNNTVILPTKSDGASGQYKSNADQLAQNFYTDTVARNETLFENSPLSRPSQQYGPGQDWRVNPKHPQTFFYETTGNQAVPLYTIDNNGVVKGTAKYPINQLYKIRVKDELENEIVEIKDTEGKTIQKRIINGSGDTLITHYVYNDLNQLKAVIQPNAYPLANNLLKTADNLFFYNYDTRNRIVEKKVPGADAEFFVYDFWDRLVLSQTALQRYEFKWTFYKYDALNREVVRGERAYTVADTQASLQNSAMADPDHHESRDDNASPIYYGLTTTFPSLNFTAGSASSDYIYQINYYDYYGNWANGVDYVSGQTPHAQIALNGSLTGSKFLGNPGLNNNNWLRIANYYDYKNRLIQSRKEHIMSAVADVCSYEYNFANELLQKKSIHKKTGASDLAEIIANTLDHLGRVTQITHTIGSVTKTIAVYEYDNISRMKAKNLGVPANFQASSSRQSVKAGDWTNTAVWENNQLPANNSLVEIAHLIKIPVGVTAQAGDVLMDPNTLEINGILNLNGGPNNNPALQKVDYKYHIRGGLLGINLDANKNTTPSLIEKDMFSYKLDYDFDFNIKKQSWKHEGNATERSYSLSYDKSHRLKSASYINVPASLEDFSMPLINYDKNGNITNLQRKGKKGGTFGLIDDLTYNYNGTNRLGSVTDQEGGLTYEVDFIPRGNNSYTYANDGSLKSDANEGITDINYNTFLRQPNYITLTNGGRIDYVYSGAGALLKTSYSGPKTEEWNYAENVIYKGTNPFSIITAEGRATYQNNVWEFEYFITDHLGNVRVSFKDAAGVATKTAITDRDPLGVVLKNTEIKNGFQNRNEFQGSKSELTFGLNRIDLGSRTINPTIGRMDRVDNYSSKYLGLSSYQFTANDFLNNIDVNGDSLMYFKNGVYVATFADGQSITTGFNQNTSTDKKGKEKLGKGQAFSFNDLDLDREKLKNGKMTLNFIDSEEVSAKMAESGITDQNVFSRYIYASTESNSLNSRGTGKMDMRRYVPAYALTIINGVGYNNADAGNYLWGYAMGKMGYTKATAWAASNMNAWWSAKESNNQASKSPWAVIRWFENRSWGGDSPADQKAIKKGIDDSGSYWNSKVNSFKKIWE